MSNVTVVEACDELAALPADILTTRLEGFIEAGCFTGRYEGPARGAMEQSFEHLARIFARAETPRLSGVQMKAPMHLAPDGALLPAVDLPFTHILKPAGTAGFEMLPISNGSVWNWGAPPALRRPISCSLRCRTACRPRSLSSVSTFDTARTISAGSRWRISARSSIFRHWRNIRASLSA